MANSRQALKRARQNRVRRLENMAKKSALKTIVKKAYTAISENHEQVVTLVRAAKRHIDKASTKGVLAKNTAARMKSRLDRTLKAQAQ